MKNKKNTVKKKRKKEESWKWTKKAETNKEEPCALIPDIQADLHKIVSPIEVFELVNGLEEQNGRNLTVDNNKLKSFLRINYIMAISKLPTTAEYWRVDNPTGNYLFYFIYLFISQTQI